MKNVLKKSGKNKSDPELANYCEACLRIRNGIFDSSATSRENNIPHTCCDINDESSKERIGIDIEIAGLLKLYEEGINKKWKEEVSYQRNLK